MFTESNTPIFKTKSDQIHTRDTVRAWRGVCVRSDYSALVRTTMAAWPLAVSALHDSLIDYG